MTTTQLSRYTDFLRELELTSEKVEGGLLFEHNGMRFLLHADEGDPSYFRLELPGIWRAGSPQEQLLALQIGSELTRGTKGVKLYAVGEHTSAAVESFEPTPDGYRAVFLRALDALHFAASCFHQHAVVVMTIARAANALGGATPGLDADCAAQPTRAQRRMGFGETPN